MTTLLIGGRNNKTVLSFIMHLAKRSDFGYLLMGENMIIAESVARSHAAGRDSAVALRFGIRWMAFPTC